MLSLITLQWPDIEVGTVTYQLCRLAVWDFPVPFAVAIADTVPSPFLEIQFLAKVDLCGT